MTEYEKMRAGDLHMASDPEMVALRTRCRKILQQINQSDPEKREMLKPLMDALLGYSSDVYIEPPFYCDYGCHIRLGKSVYFNYACTVLDCGDVEIGDGSLFGPGVQIYTATHPLDPELRRAGLEFSKKVSIGDNVWVGGGSVICPGVTIGDNSVIGAGSVVTRDIPPNVVAVGNPARVLRELLSSERPHPEKIF